MWRYAVLMPVLIVGLWLYLLAVAKNNSSCKASNELKNLDRNDVIAVVPNVTDRKTNARKIHVPKFMLDLYENNVNKRNSNYSYPDIVRSVLPKRADILADYIQFKDFQNNHLLIFDVPDSNDDEIFLSAELKILTLIDVDSNSLEGVERLVKISVYDDATREFLFVDKLQIYHTNNTWISFNVTDSLHRILRKTNTSRFLKVVVSIKPFLPYFRQSPGNLKLSLMPITENYEHDYPILLLSYVSKKKPLQEQEKKLRRKRNLEEDYEEETNNIWDDDPHKKAQIKKLKKIRNTCRKKPLYVNFAEIQYDAWIVQPRGYEAYQCQGKCFYPVAEHLSPTKHAIVQALLHSVSPAKAPRSCCVPTKLNSISVLYIDGNGVLTYRFAYQDMVVVECGCR